MAARPQISGWQWTFSFTFFSTRLRCAAAADEIYFLIYYLQENDRKRKTEQ